MDIVKVPLTFFKTTVNNTFQGKEPWQIVSITTTTLLFFMWLHDFANRDESLLTRCKKTAFRLAKRIPKIREKIEEELKTINDGFEEDVAKRTSHLEYIVSLPQNGFSREEILATVEKNLSVNRNSWKSGKSSGAVYIHDEALMSLVADVFQRSSYTNPLHPELFPGVCKMEAEVIRILCTLFHGDENSCGSMTTGGTESIMMACKAYRDYARETRGVRHPEMVLPVTAHSGFDKAGQYLGIRIRQVPVDPYTYQADVGAMKWAINRNTVMLVGSAPNFPYGTVDDIGEISSLGLKYNIPVHVDSCLGGLLTVFMEQAGYPPPVTDFRLKGVTSISADTHKYGFAPKGTSVVLYSDKKYRHHQYTVTTDWVGGVYGSPTVSGSRSGGNVAVCWATLLHHGLDGRTMRNEPMYMSAGTCYVYQTYGIYFCFNISSKEPGAAVLLRALEPLEGLDIMQKFRKERSNVHTERSPHVLCNGPSKLCISMAITKEECNKLDLSDRYNDMLWIEDDPSQTSDINIIQTSRIGISSAGEEWSKKELRFYIFGNKCVSKRDKSAEKSLDMDTRSPYFLQI